MLQAYHSMLVDDWEKAAQACLLCLEFDYFGHCERMIGALLRNSKHVEQMKFVKRLVELFKERER